MSQEFKVFVIDDEEDLCLLVKENLEAMGAYEVTTASDPVGVEDSVAQVQPDVILVDIVMPARSGQEVIAALEAKEETKHIPIIVVSGKGEMVYNKKKDDFKWLPNTPLVHERGELPEGRSPETLSEAYGVNDYISKPFSVDILADVINDVLKRAGKTAKEEGDE